MSLTPYAWLLLWAALLAFPHTVSGHGVLQSSAPAANAVLAKAPDRIELRFNELVSPEISAATLSRGDRRIPLRLVAADGARLVFRLPDLERGIYVVDWRVISAVDGHLTRGAFAFGVGDVAAPLGVAAVSGPLWPDIAVRWAGLIGVALLLGGVGAYLWLPVLRDADAAVRIRLYRLVAAAAAVTIAAGLARGALDVAAISDGPGAGQVVRAVARVLGLSPSGHDVLFRIPAAVFLVILLRPGRPIERAGLIAVLAVLMIGPLLTSHGLSMGPPGIVIGAAHLTAAGLWIGGLAFFGAVYLPVARRVGPAAVRSAALRFSRAALAAVGVLLVTGSAQAWLYAGAPLSFHRSLYGRLLLIKLIVLTPLLLLAAFNRWHVLPAVGRAEHADSRFASVVRLEAVLGLGVALLAAAVAISQPATLGAAPPVETVRPLVVGASAGDLSVSLTVDPPRPGRTRIGVSVVESGRRVAEADVRYRVALVSLTRGTLPLELPSGSDALLIDAPGWWAAHVTVRPKGAQDVTFWLPVFLEPAAPPGRDDPGARTMLRRAEALAARLRTWSEVEHLSTGREGHVTTFLTFAAPDRMAYRTSRGLEGRVIGDASFVRDRLSAWVFTRRAQPLRAAFRFPLATGIVGITLGAQLQDGGRTYQVVTYRGADGQAGYAAWNDLRSGLTRQMMMAAPGHYMVAEIGEVDAPATIQAP